MMKPISAAIGLVAIMSGLGGCATAQTASVSEADTTKIAIERVVKDEMAARGIPGLQLTIVRGNEIILTGAYGVADIETAKPVTQNTIFAVNSVSKAFAGVAVMQLVEAGKLELDAPIAAYLDGLPQGWQGITVRQVMTHISGLPEIVDDNVRLLGGAGPDAAWAQVQELPVLFEPGSRFDYTQTNYVVVGKIIEAVTGKPFAEFVTEGQFSRAGMSKAGFSQIAQPTANPDLAVLYTYLTLLTDGTETIGVERSDTPILRNEPMAEFLLPAGGVRATGQDLAKWVIALQESKLVSQSSIEQLWKPQALNDGSYRGFSPTINGYGLGWPSIRRPSHPAITPVGGARAAIFIYPDDDLTVIVLTNLLGATPQNFIDRIAAVYIPDLAGDQ